MSRYPAANWAPAGTPGGAITPRVVILHTEATAGQASPHDGLEWHFMVFNEGAVDQLVDTNRRADANNHANSFAISVETEDDGSPDADPWTAAQVDAIVALCRWAHAEHGIPLRRCDAWDGSGIGFHTMWGAPSEWTPVSKTCPGAARKAQFEAEILPRLTQENDDMSAADIDRLEDKLDDVIGLVKRVATTASLDDKPLGERSVVERRVSLMYLDMLKGGGVDEKALAAELAPLLAVSVPVLSTDDLARIAKAVADEQAKRLAG